MWYDIHIKQSGGNRKKIIASQANLLEFEGEHKAAIEGLLDKGFEIAFCKAYLPIFRLLTK